MPKNPNSLRSSGHVLMVRIPRDLLDGIDVICAKLTVARGKRFQRPEFVRMAIKREIERAEYQQDYNKKRRKTEQAA